MDYKKLELINKIENSMTELLELWHQSNQEEDDRLAKKYPFHLSFDELISEVQEWREAYYHGEEYREE